MRNNYPLVFSRSGLEHSFLSVSESEVSQDLQAVYSPIYEELETGRRLQAAEKDVQTVGFDCLPLQKSQLRYFPLKRKEVGSGVTFAGRSLGQTLTVAQLSRPKAVRLKRVMKSTAPLVRSVSAQRTLTETTSLDRFHINDTNGGFAKGKADLPPTFPISYRIAAPAGSLVVSKVKREAVMKAAAAILPPEEQSLVLTFQPRTQVYSAAFVGAKVPLSPCCRTTLILELCKSGILRILCSNPDCSPVQILPISPEIRQRLWVEESILRNSKLSSSLSLFIQRGAFKLRPIRKELDRVKWLQSRPNTAANSLEGTLRKGKRQLTVTS